MLPLPEALPDAPPAKTAVQVSPVSGAMNVSTTEAFSTASGPALVTANQSAPSGAATMPAGPELAVGTANSVTAPAVVTRPTLPEVFSVNHKAPSGPAVMSSGPLPVVTANSVTTPAVVIAPI